MRRIGDPVEVEVRLEIDGRPWVRQFCWRGEDNPVTATGRSWVDDDGRHVLVMGQAGRVFELLLRREELVWTLERAAAHQLAA
jgi:hypothetical protein